MGYNNAGTVEFLVDADDGNCYFIEVNPRIQVEHTVTEMVTGIDIVKAQIRIPKVASAASRTTRRRPPAHRRARAAKIPLNGYALQCRVTTEDPENGFLPDYGRIATYRCAAGFGIRLDAGTAYGGAVITPYYDSLLVKVTAWAPTATETIQRMDRALREFRIRGVKTNLPFLENLVNHPAFVDDRDELTTRFIENTPELLAFAARRDRATKLLRFLGEVIVNGNPEVAGRTLPGAAAPKPVLPASTCDAPMPDGTRQRLQALGPEGFAEWMRAEARAGHRHHLARRAPVAAGHAHAHRRHAGHRLLRAPAAGPVLPGMWGGATFDVAMRFLKEDPWERLAQLARAHPQHLFQMLLRASNAVGYTNYPDNVVREFVQEAAAQGIDIFRIFDSLNWLPNMSVAMEAVLETGTLCEAAICYTGDILDPERDKYSLKYYVRMAKELERMGAHILAIKDMAGLCASPTRPRSW